MLRIRAAFLTSAVAGLLFAAPGLAQATDRFVDDDSGTDVANDCTVAANPCQTVANGVAQANAADLILVDGGTYMETVTLNMGKSLAEQEFNGADMDSEAVIDGTAANAITVPAGGAGTISDFTLRSTGTAVSLAGPAQLVSNLFDSTADMTTAVSSSGLGVTIGPNNVFTDDGIDTGVRIGINVTGGDAAIRGNDFDALSVPIRLANPGPAAFSTVSGNEISGTHLTVGGGGTAIDVLGDATPVIVGNHLHTPDPDTGATGVRAALGATTATLRRNRIFGHNVGANSTDAASFTLSNDVIKDSVIGLVSDDTGAAGGGDMTATNVTLTASAIDIFLFDTALTLNSTIVEDPISAVGTATCMIDFSRGPSPMAGGNGCADFDTDAPPTFSFDGYHLSPFSPLVDLGDPATPVAPNDVDLDGQPRSLDENCDGIARRNMGADEIPRSCFGPSPTSDTVPSATAPKTKKKKTQKCKKKRKGKKGAVAAKKCKRKKKRK